MDTAMQATDRQRHRARLLVGLVAAGVLGTVAPAGAEQLTYDQALEIALKRSSRSEIIHGDLEVAERQYFARRVNFYFPEISLRGSVPAYRREETYDYLPGTSVKVAGRKTTTDIDSYIDLNQNLLTGGNLSFKAYLRSNDWRFPQMARIDSVLSRQVYVNEDRRLGSFDLTFTQPILQPSEAKYELHNTRDDLDLAKLTQVEETSTLKKEVAETYVGALTRTLEKRIAEEKFESARLQAENDSAKFQDGILSEEGWLKSASSRLDAELVVYDAQNELTKTMQDLAILLELGDPDSLALAVPTVVEELTAEQRQQLLAASDRSIPIRRAEFQYEKARRAAGFERAASGLQGTLSASFSKYGGTVENTEQGKEDLNLDTWGVTLEFTYPVWDGGAKGASVRAKEIEAQKAKVELERQRKAAKAEIHALANSVDVSSRKLTVLKKQIELTENRLRIAQIRFDNGEISRITYLESSVAHLEAQKAYVDELMNYLVDMYGLEGKFTG